MNFKRNNLDLAASPYLKQHMEQSVWWQEWSVQTIEQARATRRPIFVSVGYSTCHWCHVMAREAFSDPAVASFLNEHFVSIKVDREERPDIDQYLMHFLVSIGRSGGWPLNAFLTSELNPIFALTYAPLEAKGGVPSFLDILKKVSDFSDAKCKDLAVFHMDIPKPPVSAEEEIISKCYDKFDPAYGGFGHGAKFPPHSTLLYFLYYPYPDKRIHMMVEKTLDAMTLQGLFDHIGGGFFRYCVDRNWTVPHFEKMLYDQALGLWTCALAWKTTKKEQYHTSALKIMQCLEASFGADGLYYAALDADSDTLDGKHEEGAAYFWTYDELKALLSDVEWERFNKVYAVSPGGNFNGKHHLIRTDMTDIEDIEKKLLEDRLKRPQPFKDRKIITSWNALLGVAFVNVYRYLKAPAALRKAELIAELLVEKHFDGARMARSSIDGVVSKGAFLEDGAAMLLLLTFLFEETGEMKYRDLMNIFYAYVSRFSLKDGWRESAEKDFVECKASCFDHPIPSSSALAEWAILRTNIITKLQNIPGTYAEPMYHDFHNVATLTRNGLFHVVTTSEGIDWDMFPPNTIRVCGDKRNDCFGGTCKPI